MLMSIPRQAQRTAFAKLATFTVVYFLGAELGHALSFPQQPFATFWPPSGLYLAALLLTPRRQWWYLLLAALPANLVSDVGFHQQTLAVSLAFWLINSLEAGLGAFLVRWLLPDAKPVGQVREWLAFIGVGAFLSPLLGASLGATLLHLMGGSTGFGWLWFAWWSSDALGILLVTPLVLLWMTGPWPRRWLTRFTLLEVGALGTGMVLTAQVIFGQDVAHPNPFLSHPYWIVPFLLWTAVRFELRGAVSALFVFALIVVGNTTRGDGPFALQGQTFAPATLILQTYLTVIALMTLLLAANIQRRRQLEEVLHERAHALTLAEQQAEQQRNLLQSILDSMAEAVVASDWAGNFSVFNRAAQRIHGLTDASLPPDQWLQQVQLFLPDQATRCLLEQFPLRRALQGELSTDQMFWLVPKGGTPGFWLQCTSRPIYNQEGAIEGAVVVYKDVTAQQAIVTERERLITALQNALAEIKTLRGILPICAWCKKIRDDTGYWAQLETYLAQHTEVEFTHSICPTCAETMRPKRPV